MVVIVIHTHATHFIVYFQPSPAPKARIMSMFYSGCLVDEIFYCITLCAKS
jgi:uncharacterized protein Veg